MKLSKLSLIVGFMLFGFVEANAQRDLKQLEWMVGSWNQENETYGYNITENWRMVSPMRLEGESIKKDGRGNIISQEPMVIAKRGDDFYFEAKLPNNREVVAFKIEKITDESFTCRNTRNIFPQQITYMMKEEDEMTADLSGRGRLTQVRYKKIEMVIAD